MSSYMASKQRQVPQSNDLVRSFKTSTKLADGLTKERTTIQNELQKIGQTKSLLEEMRIASKSKKAEPILTVEERASKVNKAEIKGTGFQMKMVQSLPGATMIENQRDGRRMRHIALLKECEKFVEQFYDNFCEKKNEIKARIKSYLSHSDIEVDTLMTGLADDHLLANEIGYVNGVWEKCNQQRKSRAQEVQALRDNLNDLRSFQEKGSGSYLGGMRQKLIDIAFYLEPQVDELMEQQIADENAKYEAEHAECDVFYEEVVQAESVKFDELYQVWKHAVVRFHIIKQDDAIRRFVARMNSKEFVNPQTRVDIFNRIQAEQDKLFKERVSLIEQLEEMHPRSLTKEFVNGLGDQLSNYNDESAVVFDSLFEELKKDMDNTNEDIDILVQDLKEFLIKNDAQLDEGVSFEAIIMNKAKPYAERRKLESQTLISKAIDYQEDYDNKMSDITSNIVKFFKEFAESLDKNKEKLKQTEINFQLALANCGDHHDDLVQKQEEELSQKVIEMERAIHHVMLNEKLEECFGLLDKIQRTYRDYNEKYIEILEGQPGEMDKFFEEFEETTLAVFKRFPEDQRERIQELFTKETEDAQKKLEEEALKEWEEKKKAEEAKAAEDAKKAAADPKAKKAAPAKGKAGKDDKPQIDVPKLEVPTIVEYETVLGKKFLIERSYQDIAQKLLQPEKDEEEEKLEGEPGSDAESKIGDDTSKSGQHTPAVEGEDEEEEKGPVHPMLIPDVVENDHVEKAELLPPKDPEGNNALVPDLIISENRIVAILEKALNIVCEWIKGEMKVYNQKTKSEGKQLKDQSVEELDENLRKQWPRKGRLEVEIFQERKAQITTHNRKYERQVRTTLEKFENLKDEWGVVLDKVAEEFQGFQSQVKRLEDTLPQGKNLAQLQGTSRREKDAKQGFEERCRELRSRLDELSYIQPDMLVKANEDMLSQCQLFEAGGNYSEDEVAWYRGQMNEINEMITKAKEERLEKVNELATEIERLKVEPEAEFTEQYKNNIEELSAKDGLGKTYGQPRRFAQERLRSEMTKCEDAQKGIDQMLEKLEDLCAQSFSDKYVATFNYNLEERPLSLEIRIALISLVRMMLHYGKHLGAFKQAGADGKGPDDLPRITQLESAAELDLQESETENDAQRIKGEISTLGTIGNIKEGSDYKRFPDAIQQIDATCRELVGKLYTGENAKHLVGDQKIPEYLSTFLANMHRQVEEFKINSVRQLRMSSERLVQLGQQVPGSVFHYLQQKYTSQTLVKKEKIETDFDKQQEVDKATKEEHLRLFRPNLENPENKEATRQLNEEEQERSSNMNELIDDTQMSLLEIEEQQSAVFYTAYLNNMRALIKIFDRLLVTGDFIMLPGDEIVEKKHGNVKLLTALMSNADMSRRKTRKWPGLGANVFEIDYEKQFAAYGKKPAEGDEKAEEPAAEVANEISAELEVMNTDQHKAIVKARNEYYTIYKNRFQKSIADIMSEYDAFRKEEQRFSAYWSRNLAEITKKHI